MTVDDILNADFLAGSDDESEEGGKEVRRMYKNGNRLLKVIFRTSTKMRTSRTIRKTMMLHLSLQWTT